MNSVSSNESVTHWIANLQEGKHESLAQQQIWNRYFARLTALARVKLRSAPLRMADDEDVVLSALNSFFDGVAKGCFPRLSDRNSLWPLLAKITTRKAINQRRYLNAGKRGGGMVRGDSAFLTAHGTNADVCGLDDVIARELTSEFADKVLAGANELIDLLDDPTLRTIAIQRLQGYSTTEIAQEINCVRRTVERKLELIRQKWESSAS
jgi:DNA-directed RNA polymerase specialized sigma24 family protein